MAVFHPVAQRIRHQPQHHRMGQVQRIASARIIGIMPPAARQPVIAAVVEAAKAQGRPEFVTLAGVVVDHVEQHLDPGLMQFPHHLAELGQRIAPAIARLGRKKADRVVAPVILQAPRHQKTVIEKRLHRQQLDRGDAKLLIMLDHRRGSHPGVIAALAGRHPGMPRRQAFDMRLVDQRL